MQVKFGEFDKCCYFGEFFKSGTFGKFGKGWLLQTKKYLFLYVKQASLFAISKYAKLTKCYRMTLVKKAFFAKNDTRLVKSARVLVKSGEYCGSLVLTKAAKA